jgi:hypothetical protein
MIAGMGNNGIRHLFLPDDCEMSKEKGQDAVSALPRYAMAKLLLRQAAGRRREAL